MENQEAARIAIATCENWARDLCEGEFQAEANASIPGISLPRFWIFGSTVYRGGEQFDFMHSDIDLVCLMPPELEKAAQRTRWIAKLSEQVVSLELQLTESLKRGNSHESNTSIVLVTQSELLSDVHKTVPKGFFSQNQFLDLHDTQKPPKPFECENAATCNERFRTASSFVQATRNAYLNVSGNGSRQKMAPWQSDDSDPIHKTYMRAAAQVFTTEHKKHDVAEGLEYLSTMLFKHREEDSMIDELHEIVRVRRRARGQVKQVTPLQQLLLAELLFDGAIDSFKSAPHLLEADKFGNGLPLPVVLRVSSRGRILGTDEDIEGQIIAASVNLRWGAEPAFDLEFLELTNQTASDHDSNRSLKQLAIELNRKKELAQRVDKAIRGVRYIIANWRQLFTELRNDEIKYLKASVSGFLRNIVRGYANGGMYDLYVEFKEETTGEVKSIVASLGLPNIVEERWHSSLGISAPIELSRPNNQHAASLPPEIIAAIVIPQIVYRVTELEELGNDLSTIAPIENILCTGRWLIGLH